MSNVGNKHKTWHIKVTARIKVTVKPEMVNARRVVSTKSEGYAGAG